MDPKDILAAVRTMSACVEEVSLEDLRAAHALVRDYFLEVQRQTGRSLEHASRQRIVAALWAELEMEIDAREARLASATPRPPT